MIPARLFPGDEIRVIAPSRSLSIIRPVMYEGAVEYWKTQGHHVTFSQHARELEDFMSPSIAAKVDDIHAAFTDPKVKMIVSCIGGFNCNRILPHLDYDLIARNPKILCGYSDVTALLNAVHAKTGLVTYHGPHFSTFGLDKDRDYTWKAFVDVLSQSAPVQVAPSLAAGEYTVLQPGSCEGAIIGGNLCTLNLLQGTPYMPELRGKVLFLEDDNIMGEYFCYEFARNLASLMQCEGAQEAAGIVFGRFEESCGMTADVMRRIIRHVVPENIPVIFGADFGHVLPMITFPIGGRVRLEAADTATITLLEH